MDSAYEEYGKSRNMRGAAGYVVAAQGVFVG